MSQLIKVWSSRVNSQNARRLLNQDFYSCCKHCSILRYSSKPKEDQLVRLKEIPVNEIQEPPIIFSRGDKKLVVKDNPKSVKNQLEILTNGLERRKLQLYVEKWFKDHGFTTGSSSKVEFRAINEEFNQKAKSNNQTTENGKKRKRKKSKMAKLDMHTDNVENTVKTDSVVQEDQSKNFNRHLNRTKLTEDANTSKSGSPVKKRKGGKSMVFLNYNEDLLSYMIGCIMGGMVHHAHSVLMRHTVKLGPDMKKPQVFNCILFGWARKGNKKMMKEVLTQMEKLKISPSYDTFAAQLLGIAGQKNPSEEDIKEVMQQLKEQELDLKYLIRDSEFLTPKDMPLLLKVIRSVEPEFNHTSTAQQSIQPYSMPLLQDFNEPTAEDVPNPFFQVISEAKFDENFKKQVAYEEEGSVCMQSAYYTRRNKREEKILKSKRELMEQFRGSLTTALKSTLRIDNPDAVKLWPFLKALKIDQYVDLMMREIEIIEEKEFPLGYRKKELGRSVVNEIQRKFFREYGHLDLQKKVYKEYVGVILNEKNMRGCHREIWQLICMKHAGKSTIFPDFIFSEQISYSVGKFLYFLMEDNLEIQFTKKDGSLSNEPVLNFPSVQRKNEDGFLRFVSINPRLKKFITHGTLISEQAFYPMVVPPVPWQGKQLGGFITYNCDLIRCLDEKQMELKYLEKFPENSLHPVMDSLNILGTCGWRINTKMLDVVLELFKQNAGLSLDLPPSKSTLPKPVFPLHETKELEKNSAFDAEDLKKKKADLWRMFYKLKKDRAETHSLWCHLHRTLTIAESLRDEVIWFPHSLDFRGRCYPFMPHLNYHGDDVRRSLFQFANGKPLGEKGLDWLKIHLVNLTGFAKRSSNQERLHLANDLMPDIMDSADKPLEGGKWWQTSDEPFQTLAACMEVTAAMRSEDHTQFVSYFPTHQDGSCNGLQHYAALGRDQAGAESVNLSPFTHPQDVYSDVVELVEKIRQRDAEEGLEIAQKLEGLIKRKTIKQTVMTSVYGVTMYGAKLQIYKQISTLPEESLPGELHLPASVYLARCTFKALEEMFSSARSIQNWFTLIAQGLAKVCKMPTQWIMPMGIPVIQPYLKESTEKKFTMNYSIDELMKLKVDSKKQRNGFPPNYIHSIDASHMMLTSLEMNRAGLTFASVHDCYWTHANDVDLMNRLCRKQFVALHSQPLLETLSTDFLKYMETYQNEHPKLDKTREAALQNLTELVCNVPEKGTFDLNKVLESEYFFS
ncbi:DNA-directed RNA polymerase, mitochondrial-like [Crassostrea virginica]